MIVRNALPEDIEFVALTMRDESAAECFASRDNEDRRDFAIDIIAALPDSAAVYALCSDHGSTIAIAGIVPIAPGRAAMLFFANNRLPEIALSVTRWWRGVFTCRHLARFRRVEFTGSLPNSASGRWLYSLGFFCEGVATAYGKRGEDLAYWSWINPAWRKPTVDAAGAAVACPAGNGAISHV